MATSLGRPLIAQKLVEIARIERATAVAQQQQGRRLSEDEERRFAAALTSGIRGRVDLAVTLGDTEAYAFAQQLDRLLRQSGFSTEGVSQSVFTGPVVGVILLVQDRTRIPPGFETLVAAFRAAGVQVESAENATKPPEVTSLIVGMKPPVR